MEYLIVLTLITGTASVLASLAAVETVFPSPYYPVNMLSFTEYLLCTTFTCFNIYVNCVFTAVNAK